MSKESFVLYRSFHEALKDLTREQYGNVMFAINEYALNQVEVELEGVEKMAFTLIKPQLDANIRKQDNGKYGVLGGRPKKEQNPKQNEGFENKNPMGYFFEENKNPNANENLNANENENLNENEQEKEKQQDNIQESCNSQISLSQNFVLDTSINKDYAKQIFDVLSKNNLPNCSGNFISFLNRDFKAAMETLNNTPELKGLHSNDVLGAVQNYAAVLKNPGTWQGWKNKKSFDMFVSWKRFKSFLPDNFCLDNFIDRETAQQTRASPESKDVKPKKRCPVCGAIVDEVSQICVHCGYDYSISAIEYKKEIVSPEKVTRTIHNFFSNMAEKKKELEKELEEMDEENAGSL